VGKARDIPGLAADLPYAEAAARTVAVRADELFAPGRDVLDTEDIEQVHDMRVASRRLRAVLEIFAPCFDRDAYRPVLRDVKVLADALGARRDPDVQLDALVRLAERMGEPERRGIELMAAGLREEQAAGNETLAAALQEAEASDLHGRLLALAASATDLGSELDGPAALFAPTTTNGGGPA
jgi:CHAD domain-containing protein